MFVFFFFKQKTAYEMRISDWSSDVCSSDLYAHMNINYLRLDGPLPRYADGWQSVLGALRGGRFFTTTGEVLIPEFTIGGAKSGEETVFGRNSLVRAKIEWTFPLAFAEIRSEEHTSELQSLMRI